MLISIIYTNSIKEIQEDPRGNVRGNIRKVLWPLNFHFFTGIDQFLVIFGAWHTKIHQNYTVCNSAGMKLLEEWAFEIMALMSGCGFLGK